MSLDNIPETVNQPISLARMLDLLDQPVPSTVLKMANKGKAGDQVYIDWTDVYRLLGQVCSTFDIHILSWSQEELGSSRQLIMTGRLTMRDELGNSLSVDQVAWADLNDGTFGGAFPKAYARLVRRLGASVGIGRDLYDEEEIKVIKKELQGHGNSATDDRSQKATAVGKIQWLLNRIKDVTGQQPNVNLERPLNELESTIKGLSQKLKQDIIYRLNSPPKNAAEMQITDLLELYKND